MGSSPRASSGEKYDRRAGDQPAAGELLLVDGPGDPEVGDLREVVVADQDVARLDVAVDGAARVRGGEPVGHLGTDPGRSRRVDIGPSCRMIWLSVREGTYSMTSQTWLPSSSASKIDTTFGWFSAAECRASRSARAMCMLDSPGRPPTCLTATVRPSRSSRHSQTLPMPPRPTSRSTR